MREYHIRLRVRGAIAQFLEGNRKTSSVSALVGYKSEKNFYHAVRGITGLTPARLAALSDAELRMMLRGLVPHARQYRR